MNKNFQEPTVRASARRRLVRGAFAAPAALSLYSGGAFAATSLTCVARDVSAKQEPANTAATDTYIRVRLYTMTKYSKIISWIKGADLVALNAPSTYLSNVQWQCYSTTGVTNPPVSAGTIINNVPSYTNWVFNPTANGAYVAVRVDESGNIKGVVGLGSGQTNGYAVHQSCWASFKPTP